MAHKVYLFDELTPNFWAQQGFGISAKQLIAELDATNGEPTTLHVNSPGGSVHEALSLYEHIRLHGRVTYSIDGIAFSSAAWLGLAARRRVISTFGETMVHQPWTMLESAVAGTADDLLEIATKITEESKRLNKTQDKIAAILGAHTNHPPRSWNKMMDAETWFSADEALVSGLVNEITTGAGAEQFALRDSSFTNRIMKNCPKSVSDRVVYSKAPAAWQKKQIHARPRCKRDEVEARLAEIGVI